MTTRWDIHANTRAAIDNMHASDGDGPSLGDILNSLQSRAEEIAAANKRRTAREEKPVPTNFPITTDPVLLQNLRWAAEEGKKVEGVKTIRALIRNEIKDQAIGARISLALCAEIWTAFTESSPKAAAYTPGDGSAEDMANAEALKAKVDHYCRVTSESNPQQDNEPNNEEEPEYLLIVSRNGETQVSHFCSYDDAMYAADEELANHLRSNVTIARSLAVSVTKRYMYASE